MTGAIETLEGYLVDDDLVPLLACCDSVVQMSTPIADAVTGWHGTVNWFAILPLACRGTFRSPSLYAVSVVTDTKCTVARMVGGNGGAELRLFNSRENSARYYRKIVNSYNKGGSDA